jgi:hypothetical protein
MVMDLATTANRRPGHPRTRQTKTAGDENQTAAKENNIDAALVKETVKRIDSKKGRENAATVVKSRKVLGELTASEVQARSYHGGQREDEGAVQVRNIGGRRNSSRSVTRSDIASPRPPTSEADEESIATTNAPTLDRRVGLIRRKSSQRIANDGVATRAVLSKPMRRVM